MDEEKNGIDYPGNESASEDTPDVNVEKQGEPAAESTPDEQAAPDADRAGDLPPEEGAESSDDGGTPDGEILTPEAGESSESDSPVRVGDENLLSQDDIDSVLGEVADQLNDGNEIDRAVESSSGSIKHADFQQLSQASEDREPRNIELLMDVELPVSIELGRTRLNISDILALGPGSIVELDKLVGEPVDLLVNQKCVARGEVVVVEESFGLRITQLVSPEERLKNLQ